MVSGVFWVWRRPLEEAVVDLSFGVVAGAVAGAAAQEVAHVILTFLYVIGW